MPELRSLLRWDVICRVVDHYGDAGVGLRLARRLAASPGSQIRLVVDQPQVVLDLIQPPPPGDASAGWRDRSGVLICAWDAAPRHVDAVLETFSGDLPPARLEDMRARKATGQVVPVWLNLEHLSAEGWVEGCHGLPSPQAGGLTRWFLFPGFTHSTAGLPAPQACLPELPSELAALLGRADVPGGSCNGLHPGQRNIIGSAFCYRDSPLPALLDAMQGGPVHVRLVIPVGMPGDLGGRELDDAPGSVWQEDQLTLARIPFVDQDLYDSVLAACDFNLVRGEDSFVRAQWAGRPLLWAAYRQPGEAHLDKLAAWLERCEMPPAWASLHGWFNGGVTDSDVSPSRLWNEAIGSLGAADNWATAWRGHLLTLPSLTDTLADSALQHAQQIQ